MASDGGSTPPAYTRKQEDLMKKQLGGSVLTGDIGGVFFGDQVGG